ncbi:MAG TPA: helix-turn-helix domain-containing protein, partial [Isosphaeraceae bacterium]
MIRTILDDVTRDELLALRRTEQSPKVRDRIEMVTLSDAGWPAPRIAAHLGYHPQTVRDTLRA